MATREPHRSELSEPPLTLAFVDVYDPTRDRYKQPGRGVLGACAKHHGTGGATVQRVIEVKKNTAPTCEGLVLTGLARAREKLRTSS